MKTKTILSLLGATAILAGTTFAALADRRGERGEDGHYVQVVTDPVVLKECGSCHMAFQPSLLPAASWKKMMGDLKNHFGDNATLDAATAEKITAYLVANAADARGGRGSPVAANAEPPLRISELPWFKHKHGRKGRSSPENLKRHNAKSLADCKACHKGADKGYYEDD